MCEKQCQLFMLFNRVWKGKMTNFWVEFWYPFRDYRNDVFPFSFGIFLQMPADALRDWEDESKIAVQKVYISTV